MWFETMTAAEARMDDLRREAEERVRVARLLDGTAPTRRPGPIRHAAAIALAAVSRGSAVAVRRLDACLGDDLGRQLAAADRA